MLERRGAGRLLGSGGARRAGLHIGHAQRTRAVSRRVEVGIEHAPARAELQLEAVAFTHLQLRIAEIADQLLRGETEQPPRLRLCRRGLRSLRLDLRLLRSGGAGGKNE